jgi:acetylglutamate/LysW-gamma-L-alpha-aminoadipate kinase
VTTCDITVIKCGGLATLEPAAVCADVAGLVAAGRTVVVAHGGSADIVRLGAALGVPMRWLTHSDGYCARYTDPATLEVVTLALAGAVRPRLVTALLAAGVSAVGLSGIDGGLLRARRRRVQRTVSGGRPVLVRDDQSGRITAVNTDLLHGLLDAGLVPVVSPPVLAEDGAAVNADADRAAAAIAIALRAATLLLLTGAPGVLADPSDPASVMAVCAVAPDGPPPQRGGGMAVKLMAAREALLGGVGEVLIAGGAGPRPVLAALGGAGTRVTLGTAPATAPATSAPTPAVTR